MGCLIVHFPVVSSLSRLLGKVGNLYDCIYITIHRWMFHNIGKLHFSKYLPPPPPARFVIPPLDLFLYYRFSVSVKQ